MDNLIQERQKDISSKYLIAKSYFSGFDEVKFEIQSLVFQQKSLAPASGERAPAA